MARPEMPVNGDEEWGDPLRAAVFDVSDRADAAITNLGNRVPTTRIVGSGAGLVGGGALNADRILSVDFGTGASQAVAGNDPRLSNARTPTSHTHDVEDFDVDGIASENTFLRGDGTWAEPSGTGGGAPAEHTHSTSDITSGEFVQARIPNLPATKITSGTFAAARIPNLPQSRITGLEEELEARVAKSEAAGLNAPGWGRMVFIQNGGTVPGGTPPYTLVVELDD